MKVIRVFAAVFLLVLAVPAGVRGEARPASELVVDTVRTYTVKEGESLIEIARRFDLGYSQIVAANPGLDPYAPGTGAVVVVPTAWIVPQTPAGEGIVINLAEMRLYHFFTAGRTRLYQTFPIGIGSEGTDTPLGRFRVVEKIVAPSWHVPRSIKQEKPELPDVVPPGPANPLGSHALRLSEMTILIHGTNKPWGVGRTVSHGCIRLYPEDIPRLFERVRVGTDVTIVRQQVKVGERDGRVYVEVHDDGLATVEILEEAERLLLRNGLNRRVDRRKLLRALKERRGFPVDIGN